MHASSLACDDRQHIQIHIRLKSIAQGTCSVRANIKRDGVKKDIKENGR